jgi:hypothetical protein
VPPTPGFAFVFYGFEVNQAGARQRIVQELTLGVKK